MGIYCDTAHNQQSVMQMSHCSPLKEKKKKTFSCPNTVKTEAR